jgi:hypothetical protein
MNHSIFAFLVLSVLFNIYLPNSMSEEHGERHHGSQFHMTTTFFVIVFDVLFVQLHST